MTACGPGAFRPRRSWLLRGVAATARGGHRFGITGRGGSLNFAKVMDHVRATIQHIAPVDSIEALEDSGVSARTGTARFTGLDAAEIDGTPL